MSPLFATQVMTSSWSGPALLSSPDTLLVSSSNSNKTSQFATIYISSLVELRTSWLLPVLFTVLRQLSVKEKSRYGGLERRNDGPRHAMHSSRQTLLPLANVTDPCLWSFKWFKHLPFAVPVVGKDVPCLLSCSHSAWPASYLPHCHSASWPFPIFSPIRYWTTFAAHRSQFLHSSSTPA